MSKWIQNAVKRPGALTRKARKLHETPLEFAETHAHAPGLTGREARFALIVQGKRIPPKQTHEARRGQRPLLPSAAAGR